LIDGNKVGAVPVFGQSLSDHGAFAYLARAGNDNHEPWLLLKAVSQGVDLFAFERHF